MSFGPTSPKKTLFRIAIIDDNAAWTESLCISLKQHTPAGWEVVGRLPFAEKVDYLSWVDSNNVAAVLIDLQLSDEMPEISYSGHDMVCWFRDKMPRLPRFYLTAHQNEQVVVDDFGEVDSVFNKNQFQRNSQRSFTRILRAAINYQNEHYHRLGRLAEIAGKAALGRATEDELREARALSNTRDVAPIPTMQTKARLLVSAEELLDRCKHLLQKTESKERGEE